MSDNVLIITGSQGHAPAGGRPISARGDGPAAPRVSERSVKEVAENMNGFLKNLGQIISLDEDIEGGFAIERVEVNAEITGEGKIGFMGSGVNVGASTGIKIVLQRSR